MRLTVPAFARFVVARVVPLVLAVSFLVAVHDLLRLAASIALLMLIVFVPVLLAAFTGRYRGALRPQSLGNALTAVALAGALLYLPAITVIATTALLALGTAWVSSRIALEGVDYKRRLYPPRMFPGDTAELRVTLTNAKPLPVAWMEAYDPVDAGQSVVQRDLNTLLRFEAIMEGGRHRDPVLLTRAAIGARSAAERVIRVTGLRRGVYTLGPATVRSGDPFGLFPREAVRGERFELLVYPRLYRPTEIDFPFNRVMGEVMSRHRLHEDPALLSGSREYRPGDPMKRIHWKATARTGDMQVRLHDPSITAQLMLVVNLNTFQHLWQGVDSERMEETISAAASLATWALDAGFAVGLRSNGSVSEGGSSVPAPRVPPSASTRQASIVLDHLARLTFLGQSPETVLLDESRALDRSASLIIVTSILPPTLASILRSPALTARASVVYCGRVAAPLVPGLSVHLLTPPSMHRAAS